jgi:arginyl-tRNA--protein-N-Asp/Glu arginylyltransferase
MVYSFYDPEAARRGLGTYMILEHNADAHRLGVPYLYLGYWIQGSPKMSRKMRFQPQAQLTGNAWSAAEKALPRLASPTMTFLL